MVEQEQYLTRVTVKVGAKGSTSYYILIPKKLVKELEIKKGEVYKIKIIDKDTLVLKRIRIE